MTRIEIPDFPVLDRHRTEVPDAERLAAGVIIPFDKPQGWTSFDVVKFVRNRLQVRKVGHAGTLDPLATGLLMLCCGRATKSVTLIQQMMKTYLAEITFGASTPSYDAATEVSATAPTDHLRCEAVREMLSAEFLGEIEQVPPVYSALRKNGRRMYELARRGEKVEVEPRSVHVYGIDLLKCDLPEITLEVRCGKGFYVRSLAYDLGVRCDTLGYLNELRRTATGPWDVAEAWSIEQFRKWAER